MAGLFGFSRYNKEGPGIEKNAPKKRTFVVFFETFFRNFWKFAPISGMYILLTIPVITSGLAAVGMTNVARNTARDKHSFGLSDFFDTIKKNWKQALPAGIINTLIYGILLFDIMFFYRSEDVVSSAGLGIIICMLFIFTVMNYYMWTLIITFKFTLKQIYKNSFKFVFINFKNNLICFIAQGLAIGVYIGILLLFLRYFALTLTLEIFMFIFTFPSFKFLMDQFCAFPAIRKHIIDPYYEEHPDADIEKRRDLGVLEEEDESEDEEETEDDLNEDTAEEESLPEG